MWIRVVVVAAETLDLGWLSEPGLLILVSLAGGPRHGYAMMEDIEQSAGVRLGPGTLYGALARLERLRLIEPVASEDRRRPYRLTGAGAATLRSRLASLETLASRGLRQLAGEGGQ